MQWLSTIDAQKVEVQQITDDDGLGRSYSDDIDISIVDNTVHIAKTRVGRGSYWYDDNFKVPSLWDAVPISNP